MISYLFFVYILKCSDDSYYTGVTNNIERRLSEHQNKTLDNCYTNNRLPVELVYCTQFNDIRLAIDFEKQVKGWSRKKKEALIKNDWDNIKNLSNEKNINKGFYESSE